MGSQESDMTEWLSLSQSHSLLPASSATVPPLASSTYKSSPCDLLPHRLPISLLPEVPFLLRLSHFCSPLRETPWTRKLSEPQWTWVLHLLDVYLTLFSGLSSRTASPAYSVTGHLCCLTPQRDWVPWNLERQFINLVFVHPVLLLPINPHWMMEWTSAFISQDLVMKF